MKLLPAFACLLASSLFSSASAGITTDPPASGVTHRAIASPIAIERRSVSPPKPNSEKPAGPTHRAVPPTVERRDASPAKPDSASPPGPTHRATTSFSSIPIERRGPSLVKPNSTLVDFDRVAAHVAHIRAKYQRNLDNFRANTGGEHPLRVGLPAAVSASAVVGRDGSVRLHDVDNVLWVGSLAYGGQDIRIDFDTGSADTLVNPGAYRPDQSPTSKETAQTFFTSYGDGTTAFGRVYTDTISVGGLQAPDTAIGRSLVPFMNPYQNGGSQGISGMSYPSLATFGSNYPPFIDSLHKAGALSAFRFSFSLASSGSYLYLGKHPPGVTSGETAWVSVDSNQGFWQVPAILYGLGWIESIVDTGTTVIVGPTDRVQRYFNNIGVETRTDENGNLYGAYPCWRPPVVSFNFGGKLVVLDWETVTFATDSDGACLLAVVGADVGINAFITGDSLLRNTFAIFDRENHRVGFADRA
ncbi:hypothetical protein V8E36_007421 [Tilletia maclaganii]